MPFTPIVMQGFSGHLHVAEMSMAMYGKRSSRNCLESGPLCSPIGAYSVLAATPQLDNAKQPIILIVAHMDSAGFFLQQIMVGKRTFPFLILQPSISMLP